MTIGTITSLLFRALRHPLETAVCGLLIAMTVVVFSQVIARYIFEAPLSWSEELARFLLMWLSMLSAAYAFKTKSHFALRIVVGKLSKSAQWVMALFVHGVVSIFFAVLFYFSIVFVNGVDGHIAPALQISMQVPYASIVIGCFLILYDTLRSAWSEFNNRDIESAKN
jgi:TRAP-type C4-dicarboxylate transport system permease small subunit